ncbi:MAG TPA: HAD-IC family P-type ATPase, partial [Gammaproteobacteria bacterium]
AERGAWRRMVLAQAEAGYRVIALAGGRGEAEEGLEWLGVVMLIDPPRPEVPDAMRRAREAGIRVLMLTGDAFGALDPEGRARAVRETSVFARVSPADKLEIVRLLRQAGEIVAVTGDGVNDAPALKSADIGIAMGLTGTDVSKKAADMVLADDNFATIVAAVEEGRAIFSNIRKFLRYLLSSNMGEVMTMFFGVLLAQQIGLTGGENGVILPLLATQILWINLVTDGAPALALGVDPAHPDVMRRAPRDRREGVISTGMWLGILLMGAVMAAGTLGVLDASLPGGLIEGGGDQRYAQTMAFNTLVFFQLFNVFNARSDWRSAFADLFANGWLWGAVVLSLALQIAVIHVPVLQQAFSTVDLTLRDWLTCAAVASSVLWLRELVKLLARALRLGPRVPAPAAPEPLGVKRSRSS